MAGFQERGGRRILQPVSKRRLQMNSQQAIVRHRQSVSLTFIAPPSEEMKQLLREQGFDYDPKSSQWFKSHQEASLVGEENVAQVIAA
jgi:hypothetical protein